MDIPQIDKRSIEFWDRTLSDGGNVFGGANKSSAVLDAEPGMLRKFAILAYDGRIATCLDAYFYAELDRINLRGKEVLDFGCGCGIEAFHMARSGAIVTLCDIVPSNIQVASCILEGAFPYNALLLENYNDLDKLGSFDIIFSLGCLHHIPPGTIEGVISLLKQHLKPDGIFLILVYTTIFYPWPNCLIEGPFTMGYNPISIFQLFGPDMWVKHYRVINNGSFMWVILGWQTGDHPAISHVQWLWNYETL